MDDLTQLLDSVARGHRAHAGQLSRRIYNERARLSPQKLAQEKPGQTLEATALVHEAYLRLVHVERSQEWNGRGHFFAAAAKAMRRILIGNARRKKRHRHGGDLKRVELADTAAPSADDRLIALDEAITKLAKEDSVAAKVVELRHFAGLGHDEVASAPRITVYQARQKWTYAQAWLSSALAAD